MRPARQRRAACPSPSPERSTVTVLEVRPRGDAVDPHARAVERALRLLGLGDLTVRHRRLFLLRGADEPAARLAAARLCADPVLDEARFDAASGYPSAGEGWTIDVVLRPGVTDAEGDSLAAALALDGFPGVQARTGHRYLLPAALSPEVVAAAARALANPVVQLAACYRAADPPSPERWSAAFVAAAEPDETVETVPIRGLDDAALLALGRARLLALPLEDLRAIRDHFAALGRDPTDAEIETLAQTWSEHCAHRTFKATIHHREPGRALEIRGLLRTSIAAATQRVNRPWVLSAFVDNAGVIAFDRRWAVAFKVETHNHPSAIEPFGGANTGVGGVVRDVLGVSAEPIANTDVLCFGPLDLPADQAPAGALHPRQVYEGVVAGIADYGNKMGIPTVGGAMLFDPGYSANPLVFCGTVGLVPRGAHPTEPRPGDLIVLAGGRTGRDGIHGATFSSDVLDPSAGAELGSVVQIGDPIVEKRLADALPKARAERLYSAITDCGAGGLSSAVGEMARRLGAEVELSVVPLKYPGLRPWEIWLSEAQERMVLAVPPDRWPRLEAVFQAEGVEATVIGRFSGDGWLRVRYRGRTVVELDGRFLHEGMPVRELRSEWRPAPAEATLAVRSGPCAAGASLAAWLEAVLADPNVASKEPVVRRYDHEVQGRTVGKPFVGPALDGPADAAVLRPLPFDRRGLAIGCGINPRYGLIDPYAMALNAVDEALRNVVAVGADPDRTALLDNFCWGNPNLPDRLGGLVRAAQGCYAAAVGFRAPFISGKDSLNNEHRTPDGATRPVPGTLLVSALGIVPDLGRTVSMELKRAGDLVYLVGLTDDELGGSVYLKLQGRLGDRAPQVRPQRARRTLRALHRAIRAGLVRACHDLSEGGLGVAAAEMAFAGRLGLALDLRAVPTARPIEAADVLLFSESPSRFLVEVAPADAAAFERALAGCVVGRVGEVLAEPVLRALGRDGVPALEADLERLRRAWQRPLGEDGGR